MNSKLREVLEKVETTLAQQCKTARGNDQKIILVSYLIAMRLNQEAVMTLAKPGHLSASSTLVREQIEMRVRSIILCSAAGDFAVQVLRWFEELRHRLRFLGLEALQQETAHMDALLARCPKPEDQDLIRQWYSEKPQPQDPAEEWLRNWPLWDLERLIFEVQKNLVTSPRVRKELNNFLEFARDHASPHTLAGLRRFALIDEDLDQVTFCRDGEERWPEGPTALSTAAILDTLAEISTTFQLGLDDSIEEMRVSLSLDQFKT